MKSNLLGCAVYDKIREQFMYLSFVNSVEEYIRSNVENVIQACKNLNDVDVYVLCEYDIDNGDFIPCKVRHDWSEYKMPLSKADALAPLGVEFAKEALDYEAFKASKKQEESK